MLYPCLRCVQQLRRTPVELARTVSSSSSGCISAFHVQGSAPRRSLHTSRAVRAQPLPQEDWSPNMAYEPIYQPPAPHVPLPPRTFPFDRLPSKLPPPLPPQPQARARPARPARHARPAVQPWRETPPPFHFPPGYLPAVDPPTQEEHIEPPVYPRDEDPFSTLDPAELEQALEAISEPAPEQGQALAIEQVQQEAVVQAEPRIRLPPPTLIDFSPLPVEEAPAENETRFDWRERPLSRISKQKGDRWYPQADKERVMAQWTKLLPEQQYYEEVRRYKNHFEELIRAEQEEVEEAFDERLARWTSERLAREGYMIRGLKATRERLFGGGTHSRPVTFRLPNGEKMPFNRFVIGAAILISRTNPLSDPILTSGSVRDKETAESRGHSRKRITGRVYSVTRQYVRVTFDVEIKDVLEGTWRLDIGMDDWSHRLQLRAIQSLQLSPFDQDRSAFLSPPPSVVNKFVPEEIDGEPIETRRQAEEEIVLAGTATRDKLLRFFQRDYIPRDAADLNIAALPHRAPEHAMVPAVQDIKPDDANAGEANDPASTETSNGSGWLLSRNQEIQSWLKRYYRPVGELPIKLDGDPELHMNPSQMRAIAMMLSERLSLVQGPPGTGKTRVIIETIKLLKQRWQVPFPILVTAHTNVAVDNLLSGLADHGLKTVRVGPSERIRSDLQPHTFAAQMAKHPLQVEVEALQESIDRCWKQYEMEQRGGDLSPAQKRDSTKRFKQVREYQQKMKAMKTEIYADVLHSADVVCATCLSSNSYMLKSIDFPIVFLDEASMATEPLSIVPLMKGSSHVAIIGDHKQLPPVIISSKAQEGGLATSLFERLMHEKHVPSIMLDTQYRMHPDIAGFPNQAFYNSELQDGTVLHDGSIKTGWEPPSTRFLPKSPDGHRSNVSFIDHDHPESPIAQSISNHGDTDIVCEVVADLLAQNPTLQGKDIGIIAPYAAQIRLLDDCLRIDPHRAEFFQRRLGARCAELDDIEIKTVDGFEGREKEVIIFSTVRSNEAGLIGFLADWRRLNVGITRARRGLIMVGSAGTLENARVTALAENRMPQGGAEVWRSFIEYLREKGLIVKPDELPKDD